LNTTDLTAAKRAATEFLARIKTYDDAFKADPVHSHVSPRITGAIRRQSMELTRALADLRHPWRPDR